MACDRVEFSVYRENVGASTTTVNLHESPFAVVLPGGATITAELTFTSTGSYANYVGCERWLMAWRMTSTDAVSTSPLHLVAGRIGDGVGGADALLVSANAIGGSWSAFGFNFTPVTAGRDWSIRGVYWSDDRETP